MGSFDGLEWSKVVYSECEDILMQANDDVDDEDDEDRDGDNGSAGSNDDFVLCVSSTANGSSGFRQMG